MGVHWLISFAQKHTRRFGGLQDVLNYNFNWESNSWFWFWPGDDRKGCTSFSYFLCHQFFAVSQNWWRSFCGALLRGNIAVPEYWHIKILNQNLSPVLWGQNLWFPFRQKRLFCPTTNDSTRWGEVLGIPRKSIEKIRRNNSSFINAWTLNISKMHYGLAAWKMWHEFRVTCLIFERMENSPFFCCVCVCVCVPLMWIYVYNVNLWCIEKKERTNTRRQSNEFYSPWGVCDCEQLTDGAPCSDGGVGLVMSIGICWETLGKSSDFLM